jgi:hypothetical protein
MRFHAYAPALRVAIRETTILEGEIPDFRARDWRMVLRLEEGAVAEKDAQALYRELGREEKGGVYRKEYDWAENRFETLFPYLS